MAEKGCMLSETFEPQVDELELLREQLKKEKDRRRELELELSLTKQQVDYNNNLYFNF